MQSFSEFLTFISKLIQHWAALMTGGVPIFVLWVFEKKYSMKINKGIIPINKSVYTILFFTMFISASFLTWKKEYEKNASGLYASIYFPSPENTENSKVRFRIYFINNMDNGITIRDIYMIRVEAIDKSLNLSGKILSWCKSPVASDFVSLVDEGAVPAREKIRNDVFLTMLNLTSTDVDGERYGNKKISLYISPKSSKYLKMKFSGNSINLLAFNKVALCPAITYLDNHGIASGIICKGTEIAVRWKKLAPMISGPSRVC